MNKKERRNKWSLTIFYSLIIFATLTVALVLAALLSYLFVRFGIIFEFGELTREVGSIIWIMAGVSFVLGAAIAFFSSKLTLRPVNHCIREINKLARGDFDAKITFGFPYTSMPAFVEVSESFNKMASELRNVELLRADFINNFSHEFKTPIVSIAGFAQMLRRGNLSEEEREEYLNAIEEESMRLASMATNVLKLTKIENQGILSDKVSFNLSEQIRSAVLLLEGKWTRRSITFDMDFDEHSVFASEELLREVWINLIDNAIKFSYEGGVVKISVEDNGSDLKVSVSNSGEVIAPEDVPRIFGKFYQGDTSHATEGNGIGLAIVKKVIALHNGHIELTSIEGTTTFTVTLPKE